jgi:hypothetical protein
LLVETPCKIVEPYDNPIWEISNPSGREKREGRKNAYNNGN